MVILLNVTVIKETEIKKVFFSYTITNHTVLILGFKKASNKIEKICFRELLLEKLSKIIGFFFII